VPPDQPEPPPKRHHSVLAHPITPTPSVSYAQSSGPRNVPQPRFDSTPPVAQQSPTKQTHIGKYILQHSKTLSKTSWPEFIRHLQHPIDLTPTISTILHPMAAALHRLASTGVPAPSMAAPWPIRLKRAVIRRGPHVSAAQHFRDFLWEDMTDMVGKGFWVVLPFKQLQHYLHLKLAPCGVVRQRTRRPRPIMDYTFTGVNQASAPLAPMHAMQFGAYCNA